MGAALGCLSAVSRVYVLFRWEGLVVVVGLPASLRFSLEDESVRTGKSVLRGEISGETWNPLSEGSYVPPIAKARASKDNPESTMR